MNKTEIKLTILEGLRSVARFHEDPCAGTDLDTSQAGYAGYLRCTFKLSSCRKWLEFPEYKDAEILAVFDELSAQRKIKVFMCSASRDLHFNDLWIKAEIGRGVRKLMRFACGWDYSEITYYWDHPLTQPAYLRGGSTISELSVRVKEIRARRDAHFSKQFGTRDFPAEEKLFRQIREDDARLASAIGRISEDIKERKRESENV